MVVVADVVVVGGGPAGAAAAAAACGEGLDVELVCGLTGNRPVPGESLPPGSDTVVDDIFGAGALDPEQHRRSFANMSAWGGPDLERTEFAHNPFGHGWHIDRHELERSLLDRLHVLGVHVRMDARLAGQRWAGDQWHLTLTNGAATEMRARSIVDATGRAARVARACGAGRHRLDRLVAAYWLLGAGDEPGPDSATVVQAAADGWWYTTPVPGGRRVVAFLTDSDLLPRRGARSARDWQERVARVPHIGEPLVSERRSLHDDPVILDAGVSYLDRPAGPGWVAAGDAAVSFDPLSSQGILTALVMGAGAGRAVAAILTRGNQQPLVRWGAEYARLLETHLQLRAAYYAVEERWPTAPFWSRRQ
jgi:flavin-dependent dehydrogenase